MDPRRASDLWREMGPPCFGLSGAIPMCRSIGGWGGTAPQLSLSLRHRWDDTWVEVETEVDSERHWNESDRALHRWVMLHLQNVNEADDGDFPIRFEVDRLRQLIPVDGAPTEFTMFGSGVDWAGYALVGERTVRLDIRNCDLGLIEVVSVDPGTDYDDPAERIHRAG